MGCIDTHSRWFLHLILIDLSAQQAPRRSADTIQLLGRPGEMEAILVHRQAHELVTASGPYRSSAF